jgi:DNA-binding NarL/FixJ family response regulator
MAAYAVFRSMALEAIDRVARGGVSLVVSYISMPGMSGIELLRSIRRHDPDLPVVLVTGVPDIESATQAIEYGASRTSSNRSNPRCFEAGWTRPPSFTGLPGRAGKH